MPNTKLAFAIFTAAALLCSCSSLSKPTAVTVQLKRESRGGQRQCVRIRDLTVMTWEEMSETPRSESQPYPGADDRFDFRLERGKRTLLLSNGSRNLSPIGTADEATFRRLIDSIKTWDLKHIEAIAPRNEIKLAKRSGYWSPADLKCVPGTILAIRSMGNGSENNVGSLVFVKSLSADGELVLLISRRPD